MNRKKMPFCFFTCADAVLLFAVPMAVQGQFTYITNNSRHNFLCKDSRIVAFKR